MRNLKITKILIVVFFGIGTMGFSYAQGTVIVQQDDAFTQLLNEKRKINSTITVNDKYKIQVFYGENDKARRTLAEFKREFPDIEGTIVYESPTYKVWTGSFNSRIEAEKARALIKEKYPNALLIKPNK